MTPIEQQAEEYFDDNAKAMQLYFDGDQQVEYAVKFAAAFAEHYHKQEMRKLWRDAVEIPDKEKKLALIGDFGNDDPFIYEGRFKDGQYYQGMIGPRITGVKKWAYLSDLTKTEE